MKDNNSNIYFHNPNPPDTTATYLEKIFIAACKKKFEKILEQEIQSLATHQSDYQEQ